MKILYFLIGSIKNRIINWDLGGYSRLLAEDIVFWGPISEEYFLYNGKKIQIIKVYKETSIMDIFQKLPENWYPDIVVCETSVLNIVPDIYKCPVKTYLDTRDAWADTIFNPGVVDFFDHFSYGIIGRGIMNYSNASLLPLRSYAVSLNSQRIPKKKFSERPIDVLSIATVNNGFYHERYKTMFQLANRNIDKIKIKFLFGVQRDKIHEYYSNSKIILDWSHTLSNRSIEAALNGCLFFSLENNNMISEYWKPWEEYIPYNSNNIYELIIKYLNDYALSQNIIDNASQKVASGEYSYGDFIYNNIIDSEKLPVQIENRIRRNSSLPLNILYHRLSTPLYFNYNYQNYNIPEDWKELYFIRIKRAIDEAINNTDKIPPLIEASRMALLLNNYDLADSFLTNLIDIFPDYAWSYYLKAVYLYNKNQYNEALNYLQFSIEKATRQPELISQYVLPFIEKNNANDARRIVSFIWRTNLLDENNYQLKPFYNAVYELMANIEQKYFDKNKAVEYYLIAIRNLAIPSTGYAAYEFLLEEKKYEQIAEISHLILDENPYDFKSMLYYYIANMKMRKKNECNFYLKKYYKSLKSFYQLSSLINKISIKKALIIFLITLRFLPSRILAFFARFIISKISNQIN